MKPRIDQAALDQLFNDARTFSAWRDEAVSEEMLQAVWDLARMAPTSANCSPARIVFVVSPESKAKLEPCLAAGNLEKTMSAPATAIIGHDIEFYEKLPDLFPHTDARSWFVGNTPLIETTAFRNGSLQGAYFIIAARALGFDCGPMSGFDNAKVDEVFFANTTVKSNFLCNLGVGNPETLHSRSPRMSFGDACSIV